MPPPARRAGSPILSARYFSHRPGRSHGSGGRPGIGRRRLRGQTFPTSRTAGPYPGRATSHATRRRHGRDQGYIRAFPGQDVPLQRLDAESHGPPPGGPHRNGGQSERRGISSADAVSGTPPGSAEPRLSSGAGPRPRRRPQPLRPQSRRTGLPSARPSARQWPGSPFDQNRARRRLCLHQRRGRGVPP